MDAPRKHRTQDVWLRSKDLSCKRPASDKLARELDMAIAAAYLERVTGPGGESWPPRNAVALIDRHGEVRLNYAKVHTSVMEGLESLTTAGRKIYTASLDTKRGAVNI